LKIGNQISV